MKDAKELRRELRSIKDNLNRLCAAAVRHIAKVDAEMKLPSSVERGKRIGASIGELELALDLALRFGLRMSSAEPFKRAAAKEGK